VLFRRLLIFIYGDGMSTDPFLGRQRYPLLFAAWEHFRSHAPSDFEGAEPSVGRALNTFLTPPNGIFAPERLRARHGPFLFEITVELCTAPGAAQTIQTTMEVVPRPPDMACHASTFPVAVRYVVGGTCVARLTHEIGIPVGEDAPPPEPVTAREPGKVLRIAHDAWCGVAARAPPEFCGAALDRLLTETFPMLYTNQPLQRRMRAEGSGCEFRVRPADLQDVDGARTLAFLSKAAFERTYLTAPDSLKPGELFGVAVLFCDGVTGTVVRAEAVVMPAGEGVEWPPPLTFVPHLDPLCNVMYHTVDAAPLELFGGLVERRDQFRDDVFRRIVPSVYHESTKEYREAGRTFVLTVPADSRQNFRLRVVEEDDDTLDWMREGVEPGESFALIINFEAGDASHFVMPCMDEWPTPWVLEWLRRRPPSSACRRCGTPDAPRKRCASCKSVRYCSRACQVADWKRHRKECVLMTGVRGS
jgi:hypothetical protein